MHVPAAPQKLAIFSNTKSRPALKTKRIWQAACVVLITAALMAIGWATGKAQNQTERIHIARGTYITPTAAPGSKYQLLAAPLPDFPNYVVDHAETSVVSPDGRTMSVLTSGYNQNFAADTSDAGDHQDLVNSGEFVFVFDMSTGQAIQRQILKIPNGYSGVVSAAKRKAILCRGRPGC